MFNNIYLFNNFINSFCFFNIEINSFLFFFIIGKNIFLALLNVKLPLISLFLSKPYILSYVIVLAACFIISIFNSLQKLFNSFNDGASISKYVGNPGKESKTISISLNKPAFSMTIPFSNTIITSTNNTTSNNNTTSTSTNRHHRRNNEFNLPLGTSKSLDHLSIPSSILSSRSNNNNRDSDKYKKEDRKLRFETFSANIRRSLDATANTNTSNNTSNSNSNSNTGSSLMDNLHSDRNNNNNNFLGSNNYTTSGKNNNNYTTTSNSNSDKEFVSNSTRGIIVDDDDDNDINSYGDYDSSKYDSSKYPPSNTSVDNNTSSSSPSNMQEAIFIQKGK